MAQKPVIDYYDNLAKDYDNDRFNNTYGKFMAIKLKFGYLMKMAN